MSLPERSLELDIRTLPGTQENIAYQDGGLFPVLTLTPDGTVIAVLRGGAGHLGLPGRIEVIRSLDLGLTWTPPNVVADSDRDYRNPAFGVSPLGTIILGYHQQGNYDAAGHYLRGDASDRSQIEVRITRSHDAGLTWETPYVIDAGELSNGSPYGKIVSLPDDTLLMHIYSEHSYLVRSQDDGATWTQPSLIGRDMSETALLALPNGDLVAVMRDADVEQALHATRSSDGGHVWSAPVQITGPRQHPADMALLSNGDILLTYGNRNPPYRIEGLVSRDGGQTWLDCLLTFSGYLYGYNVDAPRPTDLGYPSSVVYNGQGATIYYYNPSINREFNWQEQEKEPRYFAEDYYAIAVAWQETALITELERLFPVDRNV